MTTEAALRKSSHKLLLVILKFIPMVTALMYLINTLFACVGIDIPVFSYIGGMSLLPWLFIWVATFVFRFCIYHRMFLYYILATNIIDTIDYYIGIPVTTFSLLMVHIVVAGIFLFLILYFYVKCNTCNIEKAA